MSLANKAKTVQKIAVVLLVLALSTGLGTREAFAYYTYNCSDSFFYCQGVSIVPGLSEIQTRSMYIEQGEWITFGFRSYTTSEMVYSTIVSLVYADDITVSSISVPPNQMDHKYHAAANTG